MAQNELMIDAAERSREGCHEVLSGLTPSRANRRPAPHANSISWLVWHIAREHDVQIAPLCGTEEVWTSHGWSDRFGLDLPVSSMGYGHTDEEAAKVLVDDTSLLTGYLDDAIDTTIGYLRSLRAEDLHEVIDTRWDPPVTRGIRLVSILDDAAQHAGQAAYVRGLLAE